MAFGCQADGFGEQSGAGSRTDEAEKGPPSSMPGTIESYVACFNAEEVAAGYLPSESLGRFLAVLELRDALRRSRSRRALNLNELGISREPTQPIERKMKRSVVERLLKQGHLLRQHMMAADDIEEVYSAVSRGLFASVRREERVQEAAVRPTCSIVSTTAFNAVCGMHTGLGWRG